MTLGYVYCRFLIMSWIPLFPMVGGTMIPTIRTGSLSWGYLTTTSPPSDMLPYLTVLLTCQGFRRIRVLLRAVPMITPFLLGVGSALGVSPQVATLSGIRGSIVVVVLGRVRLINNLYCKFLLLVSVTFFSSHH